MIGTKYTSGLLAELAETPHLRRLEVPTTPDGRRVASYTKRYTGEGTCKTTFFDVADAESTSMTVDCGADDSRFGFTLGRNVERVVVSPSPKGLSVPFVIDRWPEEGLDKRTIALSTVSSVELRAEVDVVCAIEETRTDIERSVAGYSRV